MPRQQKKTTTAKTCGVPPLHQRRELLLHGSPRLYEWPYFEWLLTEKLRPKVTRQERGWRIMERNEEFWRKPGAKRTSWAVLIEFDDRIPTRRQYEEHPGDLEWEWEGEIILLAFNAEHWRWLDNQPMKPKSKPRRVYDDWQALHRVWKHFEKHWKNPARDRTRQVLVGNLVALQQRHALRIYTPVEHLPDASYFATLAASRLVLSTPLREWHIVSTRYFEVMASGRAVLLCYREASAYLPLGIIEDTHAVMFGSPKEFAQKLLLYSNATESAVARATRRRIALNARHLVAHRHTWRHRATQVVKVLCALRVCEHRQHQEARTKSAV